MTTPPKLVLEGDSAENNTGTGTCPHQQVNTAEPSYTKQQLLKSTSGAAWRCSTSRMTFTRTTSTRHTNAAARPGSGRASPVTSTALFFTGSSSDLLATRTRTKLQTSRRTPWTNGGRRKYREATKAAAQNPQLQQRLSFHSRVTAKTVQAAPQNVILPSIFRPVCFTCCCPSGPRPLRHLTKPVHLFTCSPVPQAGHSIGLHPGS